VQARWNVYSVPALTWPRRRSLPPVAVPGQQRRRLRSLTQDR